jgi:5,10-methylenetetrahydromethanopterin reductase
VSPSPAGSEQRPGRSRVERGLQIVPTMPIDELIATIEAAEELGYGHCMLADEGLMHDVYALLGVAARVTSTIRLGSVTNGYTRHPAATAAALATIDDMSDGRAFTTLVAGGTMVLQPMGIERRHPVRVMADTIEVLRALWSGDPATWQGEVFSLDGARLGSGPHDIPIWMAARGERMLALAGEKADGIVLMAKADLGDALERVGRSGRSLTRVYLDRLAYTPEMIAEAKELYAYAIMDTPRRMLENLGISDADIAEMRAAMHSGGPSAVAPLVTDEMVTSYQIAGSPDECRSALTSLVEAHDLDAFFVNITSPGLEANTAMLADIAGFLDQAARDDTI